MKSYLYVIYVLIAIVNLGLGIDNLSTVNLSIAAIMFLVGIGYLLFKKW